MPQKMTPEERAAYQRAYRAKRKKVAPVKVLTDKDRGLPRSNYASEHDEKGGWQDTIRNISPALATTILDKIATKKR